MLIDKAKVARDLVIESPAVTHVFGKFQIDYCCGGQLLLDEACRRAKSNLDDVCRQLKSNN